MPHNRKERLKPRICSRVDRMRSPVRDLRRRDQRLPGGPLRIKQRSVKEEDQHELLPKWSPARLEPVVGHHSSQMDHARAKKRGCAYACDRGGSFCSRCGSLCSWLPVRRFVLVLDFCFWCVVVSLCFVVCRALCVVQFCVVVLVCCCCHCCHCFCCCCCFEHTWTAVRQQ